MSPASLARRLAAGGWAVGLLDIETSSTAELAAEIRAAGGDAANAAVDVRDPEDSYSAGDFVRDARREIDAIQAAGRVPLLAGGTMLYFRALEHGLSVLPSADAEVREEIERQAAELKATLEADTEGMDALARVDLARKLYRNHVPEPV